MSPWSLFCARASSPPSATNGKCTTFRRDRQYQLLWKSERIILELLADTDDPKHRSRSLPLKSRVFFIQLASSNERKIERQIQRTNDKFSENYGGILGLGGSNSDDGDNRSVLGIPLGAYSPFPPSFTDVPINSSRLILALLQSPNINLSRSPPYSFPNIRLTVEKDSD